MKKLTVGLLAHVDAGKTTLSEALLYGAGKLRALGRVDHGDAYLDTDEQEKKRGITIFSKQAVFAYDGVEVTLMDTPGHVDFGAEMERTLSILDYAVLVVSGSEGVQSHTETLWRLLKNHGIPTIIFVNKMDMAGTDKTSIMADMKKNLSMACEELGTDGFFEQIALDSEEMMERYLETGDLDHATVVDAIATRNVFPCIFGSALKNDGVDELLKAIRDYTAPKEYNQTFAARVFKISRDNKGERLTFVKVLGGALKNRDTLPGHDVKANQIRIYSGAKYELVEEASAGTVCAIAGVEDTFVGEGLGACDDDASASLVPVLSYSLQYPREKDSTLVMKDMKALEEELPELHVTYEETTREIFVMVMGQVQLEIITQMVADRYGYKIAFGQGKILYKETIKAPTVGVGHFEPLRHYAEVHLLMEPLPVGSGLQFDTMVSSDDLATNWQRLILTHLGEKVHKGVLTGAPITDMKITLTAGRAHKKHTEGGDFRKATYRAVRQGLMMGECELLEPVYAFKLVVPAECCGRAMTDIAAMDGEFGEPDIAGDKCTLTGTAPVATIKEYHNEVVAYTHGTGRLTLTLAGYAPCHNADDVIANSTYDPETDMRNPVNSVFCAHGAGENVEWFNVYDRMHVKEDPAFALAGMTDMVSLDEAHMEAANENARRKAHQVSEATYDENELEAIFVKTYGGSYRTKLHNNDYDEPLPEFEPPKGEKIDKDYGKKKPAVDVKNYLLVDGYNIIFAWDELRALAEVNIDSARDKLIDIMANYHGYVGGELILVFDAYKVKGGTGSVNEQSGIYVVYTKEAETADAYIEKTTHTLAKKHRVTVATSDGLEQMIILGHGAMRLSARNLKDEVDRACAEMAEKYMK